MSNREAQMGMDKAIHDKLDSKYESESEAEAIGWINKLTGEQIPLGKDNVQAALKDGQILIKLIQVIYQGTSKLPPNAAKLKQPFKANKMKGAFQQMENIQTFLDAAGAYGVTAGSLFATVDLFESRSMAQVLNTLLQLGTECQRNNFSGETCGANPSNKNKREFSQETLDMGKTVIGLQAGSNKGASQAGMGPGTRGVADLKLDAPCKEGQSVVSGQMGFNQGASQAGMSRGGPRHVADIGIEPGSKDAHIGGQMGYNQGASQAGMSAGGARHITDLKVGDLPGEKPDE